MLAPESLVLVAVLPAQRDLEIARLLGWYRIPLRRAPKVVDVDFLAFYQTAVFGEQHRWRIEWLAPVYGHELTSRLELFREEPEHPRAAEEYFKLQIGPLQALPRPIESGKWRRVTFLYTTGANLLAAATLQDLVVRDDQRDLLWRSLRERLAHPVEYRTAAPSPEWVDSELLTLLNAFGLLKEDRSADWSNI
ncbi:MAG: hypothetical protein HPY76_08285 [Anaerolineae bacterium]|nr:hypothetical protein [Anaerolineae bacterium]